MQNTIIVNGAPCVVTYSGKKPIEDEQAIALVQFARQEGRGWKSELSDLWMKAAADPLLHRLRNSHGPTWLYSIRIKQ